MVTNSEKLANIINTNFFFREFCYHNLIIERDSGDEIELCDLLVAFCDYLVVFQLKERNSLGFVDSESEARWFASKVLNKAKRQMKNTIEHLSNQQTVKLENNRCQVVEIKLEEFKSVIQVIMYDDNEQLANEYRYIKGVTSSEIGFIHLISLRAYEMICDFFQTPIEIFDYLLFRSKNTIDANKVSEKALIGYYVNGDYSIEITEHHSEHYNKINNNIDDYGIRFITQTFYDKITGAISSNEYHKIIEQIGLLNRNGVTAFRRCLSLAIADSQSVKRCLPYRFSLPNESRGFVFIPWPLFEEGDMHNLLVNITEAHKYEHKLEKCVGAIIKKDSDSGYCDILWAYIETAWVWDEDMEDRLFNYYPFRPSRIEQQTKY